MQNKFLIAKILLLVGLVSFFSSSFNLAYAADNSFISIVNPVRGSDFWDLKEKPSEAVAGEREILSNYQISSTWLLRFDALKDEQIKKLLLTTNDEKGLLLEITSSLTTQAGVNYHQSDSWHNPASVFLTGYTPKEREKLIDTAFEEFKKTFGFYPKSVGAWWVDSYSITYMEKKYKIDAVLIVSDQYSTDNYQIWGQYFSTPYYPAKRNTLIPAQSIDSKLNVVVMQWAARDPINGYGNSVYESTFSLQPNDYIDYHDLTSNYFSKLIDIYTNQDLNKFNHLVVGLENSYSWNKYKEEYKKQIESLVDKRNKGKLTFLNMQKFASWYKERFPEISPEHIIFASDPLGSDKKAVWFMNLHYRVGWFFNQDGSVFRDVREYSDGSEEPCYKKACQTLQFAMEAKGVLDDVTYGQKFVLDEGKITDLKVGKNQQKYLITYQNQASRQRLIEFLERDLSIDGRVQTIPGFILEAVTQDQNLKSQHNKINSTVNPKLRSHLLITLLNLFTFLIFALVSLFIPGYLFIRKLKNKSLLFNSFLSVTLGIVNLILVSYISGLTKLWVILPIYLITCLLVFFLKGFYREFKLFPFSFPKNGLILFLLITFGVIFQDVLLFRSGWIYDFGIGFWGPTGHDLIWHQALVNQLIKGLPPLNPILSGTTLTNYHYFYDLVISATFFITRISLLDLIYRFFPLLFSILLGIGTYLLSKKLFNNYPIAYLSVFFIYFGSSFGWVVTFLKNRNFGGESVFWANQPVSLNLNPPFAISLILLIATLLIIENLLIMRTKMLTFLVIILAGSLIEFKVYAGLIILGTMLIISLKQVIFKKNLSFFIPTILSTIFSLVLFLPQNINSASLLIFSPFWFIHSMIDYPDRVGWLKLSMARTAYFERGEWFKWIGTEVLGLIIFIAGNLGTRLVGLFHFFTTPLKHFTNLSLHTFIFWSSLISLVFPLFFIQKGNSWNMIQFLYYFIFFISFYSAATIYFIFKKVAKSGGLVFLVAILLITPISSVESFKSGFGNPPPAALHPLELEALNFLKDQPEGVVLVNPFNKKLREKYKEPVPLFAYETTSYVSAFSNKPTFLEDNIQHEILQNDYQKRIIEVTDFLKGRENRWSKKFLKENNIKYIYNLKIFNNSFNKQQLGLKRIFENSEVEIYQITN